MAGQPNFYNDGVWTTGVNYGFDRVTYPFINYPTKDTTTKVYEVSRAILPANYTPQAALSTYSGNSVAYLVDESDLQIDTMGRARYLLKYANVPGNQVIPSSRVITRPVMHGTSYGTNYGVSYDLGISTTIFQNPPAAEAVAVIGAPTIKQVGHGGSNGDQFAAWGNGKLIAYGQAYVINVDYYQYALNSLQVGIEIIPTLSAAAFAKNGLARYVNGPINCTVRKTQKFYLPTVTPGITTFADIPLQTPNMDPVSWMREVVTNQAWTVESVTELAPWMGPILYQEISEVQMSDAKDAINLVA